MEIQDFAETSASILANLLDAPGDFKAVQWSQAIEREDDSTQEKRLLASDSVAAARSPAWEVERIDRE